MIEREWEVTIETSSAEYGDRITRAVIWAPTAQEAAKQLVVLQTNVHAITRYEVKLVDED